jgi:hypothetical protein
MLDYLRRLTDDELIASLLHLCDEDRKNTVAILVHLQVMDDREIAERRAFDSLFEYCIRELRWAEGETARRIQVARAAVRFPSLLRAIRKRLLNLTTAALLAPHLTKDNYSRLARAAYGQRARAVEALVATLAPKVEPKERVRLLGIRSAPSPAPASSDSEPISEGTSPADEKPILLHPAPQRVHFSFTSDERLLADVERAKDLLKGKYPAPDYEAVFGEGVRMMLERIDPDRRNVRERAPAQALPGDARSRVPPAWVKRAVWRRDSGHCAFRGEGGRLCRSTAGLQYDHIVPYALGGRSDDPANIRLLCRTHNRLEARRSFGDAAVEAAIAAAGRKGKALPRAASEGTEGSAPGEAAPA